jgi:ribosomal protein S21
MISVKSRSKNNQKLLSQFKSLVNNEKIIETYKSKQYYIKPSLKKKLKREAAERQRAKDFIDEIKEIQKNKDDFF